MISGAQGEPQGRRHRPGTSLGSHGCATDRHLVARVEATGQEVTWRTWRTWLVSFQTCSRSIRRLFLLDFGLTWLWSGRRVLAAGFWWSRAFHPELDGFRRFGWFDISNNFVNPGAFGGFVGCCCLSVGLNHVKPHKFSTASRHKRTWLMLDDIGGSAYSKIPQGKSPWFG